MAEYIVSGGKISSGIILGRYDIMSVLDGGTANSTTVDSGGEIGVSSGGIANDTTLSGNTEYSHGNGKMYVRGTANGTIVEDLGDLYVLSGGTANNTTANAQGRIEVFSGGTINSTILNLAEDNGYCIVSRGGTANSTTVINWGPFYIDSGGVAMNTILNDGYMYVFGGGKLTGKTMILNGAEVSADEGAILDFDISGIAPDPEGTPLLNDLSLVSGWDGAVYTLTVNGAQAGGKYVLAGGAAGFDKSISVVNTSGESLGSITAGTPETISEAWYTLSISGGVMSLQIKPVEVISGAVLKYATRTVNSGQAYQNTTVSKGGRLDVSGGGFANGTTAEDGGCMCICSGGVMNDTYLKLEENEDFTMSGGTLYISSGGTANSTSVGCGKMYVSSGGTANSTTVDSGTLHVSGGGTANNTTVHDNGHFYVSSGGIANSTTVAVIYGEDNTSFVLLYGGTANCTTLIDGGQFTVSGGIANDTTINSSGRLSIRNGGTANGTIVNSGGRLEIYSGCKLNSTTVNSGGELDVSRGVTANNTTVNSGGYLYVYSGGTASVVFNPFGGQITSDTGAVVTYLEREADVYYGNGASGTVSSANTMTGLAIASGFSAVVFQGGRLESATAQEGCLHVSGGGIANDITMNKGYVYVYGGGKLTGRMTFNGDAFVSACTGAILDFDLTQTSAGATALLNNLSCVQGTPTYTLTVNGTESSGTYSLADGVSFFGGVISVIKTSGEQLGSLMVGQKLETEYADYALKVSNSSLTLTVTASGTVPPAGDTTPPSDPTGLDTVVSGQKVALVWNVSSDDTGVKEYVVRYLLDGQVYTVRTGGTSYVLSNADAGSYSWSVQAVDFAGNESGITAGDAFTVSVSEFRPYTVEYSADNFEHTIRFTVTSPALNTFHMPGGTYQMRVRQEGSSEWQTGDPIVAEAFDDTPQLIKSDADDNADVFFVNASDTWKTGYVAQHAGSVNDWSGTGEYAALFGKNKLTDIFEGSTDANILLMTDDDNGDALFVDDIYSDSPDKLGLSQSRIAQIDEIRAGAGNDIVDMTSQRFEYIGDGLTIRGGDGDDVIWTNKGDNRLFGDAGNDRIAGASGNDVIAGGSGNDRMHGGGGNDVFTFCDNWGVDNVEQLASGSVTLWFASGSEANWNAETLTCTDGENSVKVSGVTADRITLKFGDDGSAQFASLSGMGAFFDATSERIFEESGKGILASL